MNLIPNGDFKSLNGWKLSNSALITLAPGPSGGVSSVKLSPDHKDMDGAESTSMSQQLDIRSFDSNSEYRMKFRARSDHFGPEYRVYIAVMQASKVISNIGLEWRQVGAQWQDVQVDFKDISRRATAIKLIIQVKAPGTAWISSLSIEKLPAGTIDADRQQVKDLPKYGGSPQHVNITNDRRFVVKGKPFFPIGMWGIDYPDEAEMDDLQKYGFNITGTGHFSDRGPDGVEKFLDQLQARGLMAMGVTWYALKPQSENMDTQQEQLNSIYRKIIDVTRTHPAFFGYDIGDEVAWAGNDVASFGKGAHYIRSCDPNHPIFTCAAPRGSIAHLAQYNRYVDMGGSDIYPWCNGEPDFHSDLPNKTISVVGDECVKSLKALGGNKPVLMTLQAFGWSDGTGDDPMRQKGYGYPPDNILRFMVFDAIVSGATGIMLYQNQFYQGKINPKVKLISLELRALHDLLAAPTEAKSATSSDKRVPLIVKNHNGKRTIIAVNRSDKGVNCQITVPKGLRSWQEMRSHKMHEVTKGSISCSFDPWGVNIYEQSL